MAFSVDLYHRGANTPYFTIKKLTHNEQLMGEDYVTVSLEAPTVKADGDNTYFMVGDWLMYRGVKYVVDVPPTLQKQARVKSVGNAIVFDQVKLANELCHVFSYVDFRDVVNGDEHYNFAARQFSFYCVDLCTLAERINANLERDYSGKFNIYVHGKSGGVGYNYLVGGTKPSDFEASGKKNLVVSISDCKLWDGLAHVKDDFDVNFVVRNDANGVMSIFLGANGNLLADQHFAYGKGNGLFKIERVTDNSQAIITKLRAYGAETNMPTRYYRNIGLNYFANVSAVDGTEDFGTVAKVDIYPSSLTINIGKWDSEKAEESRSAILEAVSGEEDANVNAYFNNVLDYHYLNGATYYYAKAKVDGLERGVLVASLSGTMYFLVPDSTGATKRYSGITNKKVYFTYGYSKNGWPSGHTEANQNCKLPNNMNVKCLMLPGFGFYTLKSKVKEAFTSKKASTINVLKEYYNEGKPNNGFDALCEVYTFSEDPTDPWVAKKSQLEAYGCREGQEVFDDSNEDYDSIYPSLQYVGDGTNKLPEQRFTAGGKEYSNSLPDDGGVCDDLVLADKQIAQWHLFVKDPGFDPYKQRPDGESQITVSFKDGMVGGKEFKCVGSKKITKDDGSVVYMLTLDREPDDSLDLYFPYEAVGGDSATKSQNTTGVSFVPKVGDEIVYLGIEMPSEYVEDAALRQLLPAAMETLDKNCDAQYKYNLTVDEIHMARQHDYAISHNGVDSMHDTMRAGDVIIFGDEDLGFSYNDNLIGGRDTINAAIIIDSIEITENEGALPKYTVNLVQQKQLNSIQKIQKQIDSIVSGATSVSTNGGGYSAAEIQKLIRTYGNRWYLSKAEDDTASGNITFEGVVTHKVNVKSNQFSQGDIPTVGAGWQITPEGKMVADSLVLRESLTVPELRYNRVTTLHGIQWHTAGSNKIKTVERRTEEMELGANGYYDGIITLDLEDGEFGSLKVNDKCMGIWHMTDGTPNDTEDLDGYLTTEVGEDGIEKKVNHPNGNFHFAGFKTIYFLITEALAKDGANDKFKYVLRSNDDEQWTDATHPQNEMHVAAYANETDGDRQACRYDTIGYEINLVGMTDWTYSPNNIIKIEGNLNGFSINARRIENGQWVDYYKQLSGFGIAIGKMYRWGNDEEFNRAPVLVSQQLRYMVTDDDIDTVKSHSNWKTYYQWSNDSLKPRYRSKYLYGYWLYTYDSDSTSSSDPFFMSEFVGGEPMIEIGINGDNLLALGETKDITFKVVDRAGNDYTSDVWLWKIERTGGSDADSDMSWGARQKAKDFAQQSYVDVAIISLTWSDDPSINDLDPDINMSSTTFLVTATLGDDEIQETLEI